jgi:hypothetical protein
MKLMVIVVRPPGRRRGLLDWEWKLKGSGEILFGTWIASLVGFDCGIGFALQGWQDGVAAVLT